MALPFTQVQTKSNSSASTTSLAVTFTNATKTGNSVIVVMGMATNQTPGVTDNYGNVYTQIERTTTTGNLSFWVAKNISGGATHQVTGTAGSTVALTILVAEYAGISILDTHTKATGTSANLNSGASAVSGQPSALVIGVGASTVTGTGFLVGAGYSHLVTDESQSPSIAIEDKLVTTTGAQTATFTATSTNWSCAVAVFTTRGSFVIPSNNLRPHAFSPGLAR